jgi:hypothetical protein
MSILDLLKEVNFRLLKLLNLNTDSVASLTIISNDIVAQSGTLNKMELITGTATNKAYKYLLVNASTKFTVLTDSTNANMLTGTGSMLIADNTIYTGVMLYPHPGKTFKDVTVNGGNVFGFYA